MITFSVFGESGYCPRAPQKQPFGRQRVLLNVLSIPATGHLTQILARDTMSSARMSNTVTLLANQRAARLPHTALRRVRHRLCSV